METSQHTYIQAGRAVLPFQVNTGSHTEEEGAITSSRAPIALGGELFLQQKSLEGDLVTSMTEKSLKNSVLQFRAAPDKQHTI